MQQPRPGQIVWFHYASDKVPLDGIASVHGRVIQVHGFDLVDVAAGNGFYRKVSRGDKPSDPNMIRAAWSEIDAVV